MPPERPRRLLVPVASLYDEISRQALSAAWSRADCDAVEREHPALVIRHQGNVLATVQRDPAGLAYAFRSNSDFIDYFPGMFEQLLPRVRRELGSDTIRFRLEYNPARPVVEPVLKNLYFAPGKPWLGFTLVKKTPLPKLAPLSGVKFRAGGIDDVDALVRIDRAAFPDTPLRASALRERIAAGEQVLVATVKDGVIGCALYSQTAAEGGYLWIVAVLPEHQGRGIGAALTARAAKAMFAAGAAEVRLKTDDDNGTAIRLYMRLGFRQTTAGGDYSRPTDPRAITRIKKLREGTLVRFGDWR
jgi:ribosomal protein S18 acetylase RimI-like enzyme